MQCLSQGKWTHPYPQMKIARSSSTAVSFNNHIIVAGGVDNEGPTSSVEVLDVASRRWYIAQSLPNPRSGLKSTLIYRKHPLPNGRVGSHWANQDSASRRPQWTHCKSPFQPGHTHSLADNWRHTTRVFSSSQYWEVTIGRWWSGRHIQPKFIDPPLPAWHQEVGESGRPTYCTIQLHMLSILPSEEIIVAGGSDHDRLHFASTRTVDFLSIKNE